MRQTKFGTMVAVVIAAAAAAATVMVGIVAVAIHVLHGIRVVVQVQHTVRVRQLQVNVPGVHTRIGVTRNCADTIPSTCLVCVLTLNHYTQIITRTLFACAVMDVLLLAGARILEPHLRHPFAQTGDGSDAFQVLAVRIAIYLKIGLQHLQLFFGECGSNSFRFAFMVPVGVTTIC